MSGQALCAAMTLLSAARNMFSAPGSLRRRAANAGAWSIGELGMNHALRLASNLVMTRLLAPDAFGVMAMVTTLIIAMNLFTDIGIQQSIIRSPRGEDPHFLRVAWSVQILRFTGIAALVVVAGILLWQLGPVLAPRGTVYADPDLPFLIMGSALAMIFKGLESNNQWLAARRMEYARTTLVNLTSQVIGLIAMIGFASVNPTVWALLAGMLTGAAAKALLSHLLLIGPRMALIWDKQIADDLWHFGKWIMGSSAFAFVAGQADRLILGGLLDKRTFGTYVIAVLWVGAVKIIIQKMNGQIGFAALSEVLHKRPGQIQHAFRRFSRLSDLVCSAGFLGGVFGGPALIALLYNDSYLAAAGFMPILSLSILQMRFWPLGSLILASGDSKTMMLHSGITAVLLCTFLPLGYRFFGMEGALLALTLAPLCASPVIIHGAAKILGRGIASDVFWICGVLLSGVAILLLFPI